MTVKTGPKITRAPFRARARLLSLLGDQLIGRDYLAVFELVKNAYDADASEASVRLEDLDSSEPCIIVEDDGEGMDEDILVNKWLEIGNDHRERQRREKKRTDIFNRLPLGEKGLGRIACHKLGDCVEIITRQKNKPECFIQIHWSELIQEDYLDQTQVEIEVRSKPKHFTGSAHGTYVRIAELKSEWTRKNVRSLNRVITSICSPFEGGGNFAAVLKVPDYPAWTEDMLSSVDFVEGAPWKFSFNLAEDEFSWSYEFKSPTGQGEKISGQSLKSSPSEKLLLSHKPGGKSVVHSAKNLHGIGPISGEFYAYDKDPKIMSLYPQPEARKKFLKEQSGIRVYRSNIRVFNYGEPGDDWLTLDLRRVNSPTERLSQNIVVGNINIDLAESDGSDGAAGLREKTNREGFDENEIFVQFRDLILAVVSTFERMRARDKKRLKDAVQGAKSVFPRLVEEPASELRAKIEKTEHAAELLPLLDRVESDYRKMRDILLRAGMSGLNLAVVVHEVHRGVLALYEAIRRKSDPEELKRQAHRLVQVFETIAGLLRQRGSKKANIREVVKSAAVSISGPRFRRHHINVEYDLPEMDPPFVANGSFDLLLGALTNLIDNALYWLRVRYPDVNENQPSVRRLYIGISENSKGERSLIVADNGTGFTAAPEDLMEPFVTGRPDGSGLGLYYASLAVQLCDGTLSFPDSSDIDLPPWVDGAVVAMNFPEPKP